MKRRSRKAPHFCISFYIFYSFLLSATRFECSRLLLSYFIFFFPGPVGLMVLKLTIAWAAAVKNVDCLSFNLKPQVEPVRLESFGVYYVRREQDSNGLQIMNKARMRIRRTSWVAQYHSVSYDKRVTFTCKWSVFVVRGIELHFWWGNFASNKIAPCRRRFNAVKGAFVLVLLCFDKAVDDAALFGCNHYSHTCF